jgi:hypothetical protein
MQEIEIIFLPHFLQSEKAFFKCHNTQRNDIQHNNTQHNDIQHSIESLFATLSVNDTQHKKNKRHTA